MLANEMFQSVSKGAQNRNRKPDYESEILYLATVHNEEFTEFKRSRRTRKKYTKEDFGIERTSIIIYYLYLLHERGQ